MQFIISNINVKFLSVDYLLFHGTLFQRKNNELDEESLQISGQLLSANPDIYTLWDFRKEILLYLKDSMYVISFSFLHFL